MLLIWFSALDVGVVVMAVTSVSVASTAFATVSITILRFDTHCKILLVR